MDEFSGVGIRNTTSDSNRRPGSGNHMSATETGAAGDCLLHPYQIHSSDMELNIVQVNISSPVAAGNESGGYNSEDPSYKLIEMISVGVVLGLIDLTTVLGNLLVCVTIASVRRLHSVTNFLIFSLAVCDLLLGCLVLPFSVLNTILPDAWPLGSIFCNLFVSTDVMLCTVSILTLLVISLDRYLAIVMPFRYCRYTACRWRYCSILSIVWLFSFAMAFVPIHFGWNTETGLVQNFDNPDRCEFRANAAYVLLVAIGTYFFPLVILCTVYVRVLAVAKRQAHRIRKDMAMYNNSSSDGRRLVVKESTSSACASQHSHAACNETKATITLGSVVLAFTICWVPYFVLFTARPFVEGGFNATLDLFTLWLGYANSMLNPFLYGFYSAEFRYGFIWVLRCRRSKRDFGTNRSSIGTAYDL